jgi:hypothetical protein
MDSGEPFKVEPGTDHLHEPGGWQIRQAADDITTHHISLRSGRLLGVAGGSVHIRALGPACETNVTAAHVESRPIATAQPNGIFTAYTRGHGWRESLRTAGQPTLRN